METRKAAIFRLLRELGEQQLYTSFESIRAAALKVWPEMKADTLRHYLSEAATLEIHFKAGRGWYSSLSRAAVLSEDPVKNWVEMIAAAFPLLEFTCWSTLHWNPWLRHLVNRPTTFLQCDPVSLPAVHEWLVARGRDSRQNPTAAEVAKNPLGPDTVVLRPRFAAAPACLGPLATVEQVMVDTWVENKTFHLFDPAELHEATPNWLRAERVQLSSLIRYAAARMGKEEHWISWSSIIEK
jgi:hypothetical protein